MSKKSAYSAHREAIMRGEVTKTNIWGLRKMLNAHERSARGYDISSTSSNISAADRDELLDDLLPNKRPLVTGELHDTGVVQLKSPRYRKQLASVADIIADIKEFRLVGFDYIGRHGDHVTPVYRAYDSKGQSFPFCNIPWQSGGNGPEIMSGNYW